MAFVPLAIKASPEIAAVGTTLATSLAPKAIKFGNDVKSNLKNVYNTTSSSIKSHPVTKDTISTLKQTGKDTHQAVATGVVTGVSNAIINGVNNLSNIVLGKKNISGGNHVYSSNFLYKNNISNNSKKMMNGGRVLDELMRGENVPHNLLVVLLTLLVLWVVYKLVVNWSSSSSSGSSSGSKMSNSINWANGKRFIRG